MICIVAPGNTGRRTVIGGSVRRPAGYVDSMRERLVSLMEVEGLEYGDRTHAYHSPLGQELANWAA